MGIFYFENKIRSDSMTVLRTLLLIILIFVWAPNLSAQQTLSEPQTEPDRVEEQSEEFPSDDKPSSEPSGSGQQDKEPEAEKPAEQESPQTAPDSDNKKPDDSNQDEKPSEPESKTKGDPQASSSKSGSRRKNKSRFSTKKYSKNSEQFISVFAPVVASTSGAVVKITDGKKQIALGTVVDPDGLILTKASEMRGDLKCILADGTSLKPKVVGVDPDSDLILLQVKADELNYVRIDDQNMPNVGSWLASVDQDEEPLAVGIVSHQARKIRSTTLNSAVVGIFPEDREEGDGVRINFVVIDSPAEKAGVLVNDIVIGIDDDQIMNRAQLMEKLSHFQPGDEIVLKVKRGDELIDFQITLGKRNYNPMMDRGNRQNRMGSTLSKRRGDFALALQHDSALNADDCGGPIVDLNGQVVGINIARDGRVSSLALPNEIVVPIIAKLRTGKWTPEIVNKEEIEDISKLLAKLTTDLGDLPERKTKQEIEFSAGAAVEKELELQVKETEQRLKALQARLDEKKKLNKKIIKAITEIDSKRERIERRREPLELDLKRLKTGVR